MSEALNKRSGPEHQVINVTKAFLPPQEEYLHWLNKVYASHVLTNNGPIHRELEETLRARFEVPYLRLMTNGTLALLSRFWRIFDADLASASKTGFSP